MPKFSSNMFITITLLCFNGTAQVPKKIIVEHFTNSNCSICASLNPGFYTNFSSQTNTLHMAIYPSSPYASCLLSQQNMQDADARTNFYGIYGSTPELVINGNLISVSSNYADSALFSPYKNQTSPIQITLQQTNYGTDSVATDVKIKTVVTHNLPALSLFVGIVEDTIQYTGGNGEPLHYDVLRKSMSASSGNSINIPATIGDSTLLHFTTSYNPIWNLQRMYSLAILQETSSKQVVQAERSGYGQAALPLGLQQQELIHDIQLAPNPVRDVLHIQASETWNGSLQLINWQGNTILKETAITLPHRIDLSGLGSGFYLLRIETNQGKVTQKIIKQ